MLPVVVQVLHSLEVGGAEMLAARLSRRLRDRYTFVFACLDALGTLGLDLQQDGFEVVVLNRKPGIDLGCVRRLAQLVEQRRASVIHAHQYTPFFYARSPGWWGRRPPVLFTEHGRNYPDVSSLKRRVFNRFRLRKRDRVVAVGKSVMQSLVNVEGFSADRVDVIYNGVRLDDFRGDQQLRSQVRRELNIGGDQFVLLQVARLDYLKDHCTAVRTLARLIPLVPPAKLILVGEGPERSKIEAEIAKYQLQEQVQLLGTRKDIRRLLAAADAFLLTSISEGIPVTLIEAAAAGLPIVSTDVGGVPEVIVRDTTGYLAGVGDDNALSRAVLEVLHNPAEARRRASAAAIRARELFSEVQMHEAYAALYDTMLPLATTSPTRLSAGVDS